jgi:hemin uptake protein HemP
VRLQINLNKDGAMVEQPSNSSGRTQSSSDGPPVVSSRDLLAGHREIIIEHGREHYRLRLTSSNKLILIK